LLDDRVVHVLDKTNLEQVIIGAAVMLEQVQLLTNKSKNAVCYDLQQRGWTVRLVLFCKRLKGKVEEASETTKHLSLVNLGLEACSSTKKLRRA